MSSEPMIHRRPMGAAATGHQHGRALALHLAVAAGLGVLADVGLRLGDDTAWLFVVASPWVLLAFSAGRAAARRWSPVAGAGTLLAGLAAYYLWLLLGPGVSLGVLTGSGFKGAVWLAVGAVVGAAAGAVGGLTRSPRPLLRDAAWCGAVAVPCVDAIIQLRYAAAPPVVAAVLGGAAVALLVWAWRSGSRTWALALGAPLATLLLWQLELAVLQQAFGRLTWV